jgi:23S rRNA (adenine2503-C2)-methyltransferase
MVNNGVHPNLPKPLIYDFDLLELETWVKNQKEPAYRAKQIWDGLYRQLWGSIDLFTPLSLALRTRLKEAFSFTNLFPSTILRSLDKQTDKVLFVLPDGLKIETVLMRYEKRNTLCISTQSGCAMGCSFCATGQMGFKRNLSPGEIVEQIVYFFKLITQEESRITNVVFMGMGEPFHNFDAVMKAIGIVNHPLGMRFGERRFTISTVGIIPGIQRFTEESSQVNLAISLHAADDELRSSMLPVNLRFPLDSLIGACLEYINKTHRRVSFEWALIEGVNDSIEQAEKLTKLLAPFVSQGIASCHVNVIQLNPTPLYKGRPASADQAKSFCNVLQRAGLSCTIRLRRGIGIAAGCGQLASK